jgi:hypothetical protein
MRRRSFVILCLLSAPLLPLAAAGCTLIGAVAGKVVPPPTIAPRYTGFQEQPVAIMVWADEGTMIDFPDARVDLAGSLQNKLQQAQQAKTKELTGITFPRPPAAVARLQDSHPEYEALPLTQVAPKLGTSRVIYVEIESLQTRSDASVELFRGSGSATVKVVEVPPGGEGEATIAYEESGIAAVFPPNAREEGSPDGNDFTIYRGTVDALTTEIAKRFVPHQEEQ